MFNRKLKARIASLEATVQRQDRNLELANREHSRLRPRFRRLKRNVKSSRSELSEWSA